MNFGKKILGYSFILPGFLLASCGALKPLPSPTSSGSSQTSQTSPFLENINAGAVSGTAKQEETVPSIQDSYTPKVFFNSSFTIDRAVPIQFKYAILLNTEVEYLGNSDLYSFIDHWWGTPYRNGGMTQRGVDCSAFVQNLDAAIYNLALPRTAREQYSSCEHISKTNMKEGDLLFFNTKGGVSHVGVYLQNNKFVHASTSNGVMISDLGEAYWSRRFLGAGRPDKSFVIGN
jgi:murein DD-endopeptidase / murein LD-carboxypeptidase